MVADECNSFLMIESNFLESRVRMCKIVSLYLLTMQKMQNAGDSGRSDRRKFSRCGPSGIYRSRGWNGANRRSSSGMGTGSAIIRVKRVMFKATGGEVA